MLGQYPKKLIRVHPHAMSVWFFFYPSVCIRCFVLCTMCEVDMDNLSKNGLQKLLAGTFGSKCRHTFHKLQMKQVL